MAGISRVLVLLCAVLAGEVITMGRADATDHACSGLGFFPGATSTRVSSALGVSADGAVVVGYVLDDAGKHRPFRWTAGEGLRLLTGGSGGATPEGIARAVSGDGRIVVGWMRIAGDRQVAYRWSEAGGFEELGFFPDEHPVTPSYAQAVDADGAVVVGSHVEAFRWTPGTGLVRIGRRDDGTRVGFDALAVSAHGDVIVGLGVRGQSHDSFRWTARGGIELLGHLGGGGPRPDGRAQAVSADGAVVAGYSTNGAGQYEGYRWTTAEGLRPLGFLAPGIERPESTVFGMSADGRTIVGSSVNAERRLQAFVWTAADGMRPLPYLGPSNAPPEARASAASADGRVIVGQSSGPSSYQEAFLCRRLGG